MIPTILYALASFSTFILMVCMLQGVFRDSHWLFRFFFVMLAAGVLASTVSPFVDGYRVGWWALLKTIALFGLIVMMRRRQLGTDGDPVIDRLWGAVVKRFSRLTQS